MASYPPPPPPPPGYGGPPPGYGGPPPGYGPPGGYQPTRSTNGKAIAALICGIAAFAVCPLTAIAAVILGPQAKREIEANPAQYEGVGLAKAGQILGWINIALWVLLIILFIVLAIVGASTSSTTESLALLAG